MLFIILSLFIIVNWAGCSGTVPARGDPIRVGVQKEEGRLHEIPLERYVASVLEKEVNGNWPIESLKAQAVATRTYALYRKQNPRSARFDVLADTSDQVYEKASRHSPAIIRAVTETEGEVLEANGKILQAFFHSCCGGMSESADHVWPGSHPEALLSVHEDPYCNACPPSHWEYRIPRDDLAALLSSNGYGLDGDWAVEVTQNDSSGRVSEVTFKSGKQKAEISGAKFRQILGNGNLKSTLFEISKDGDDNTIVFLGRGSGHGVGLCQWGAKGMAEDGKNYREILEFYYPGAEIQSPNATSAIVPEIPGFTPDPQGQE